MTYNEVYQMRKKALAIPGSMRRAVINMGRGSSRFLNNLGNGIHNAGSGLSNVTNTYAATGKIPYWAKQKLKKALLYGGIGAAGGYGIYKMKENGYLPNMPEVIRKKFDNNTPNTYEQPPIIYAPK